MKQPRTILLLCLLVGILTGACGYRFAGTGSLPKGAKIIFVSMLQNKTVETDIERQVTDEIIRELTRNGVAMTKDRQKADAVLKGSVVSVYTETIARSSTNTSSERRINIRLSMELINQKGVVLWRANSILERQEYPVGTDEASEKKDALETLAERLSQSVYLRMVDTF